MTEPQARPLIEELARTRKDLEGLQLVRLRQAYLEVAEGEPGSRVLVRDVRVWIAELRAGLRGAQAVIDDGTGEVLQVEHT